MINIDQHDVNAVNAKHPTRIIFVNMMVLNMRCSHGHLEWGPAVCTDKVSTLAKFQDGPRNVEAIYGKWKSIGLIGQLCVCSSM